jgi:hypothetical protein
VPQTAIRPSWAARGVHHPPWPAWVGAATGQRLGHLLCARSRSSPFGPEQPQRSTVGAGGRARLNDRCSRARDPPRLVRPALRPSAAPTPPTGPHCRIHAKGMVNEQARSRSSKSAASGRATRCARTAPLPRSRSSPCAPARRPERGPRRPQSRRALLRRGSREASVGVPTPCSHWLEERAPAPADPWDKFVAVAH